MKCLVVWERLYAGKIEREQDVDVLDEDDPLRESPAAAAERIRQFTLIKELLTATTLGTFMTDQRKRFSMRCVACKHKRVHPREYAPSQ
jgi:hypothetical protein